MSLRQSQITRTWEGMLSSEMRAYYYADLATRQNRIQRAVDWFLLLSSSAAVVSVMAEIPADWADAVRLGLGLVTAALSFFLVIGQPWKVAADCSDLHARWAKIAADYRSVWEDVNASDAEQRLDAVEEQDREVSKVSHHITVRKRLLAKWEDYVVAQHAVRA